MTDDNPLFLTTSEVAEMLRVKERKVYDLAAEGSIPHRRITGKLLFPREALLSWAGGTGVTRPAVLAGSHDPLLDWALRESGCGLAMLCHGSLDGLDRFEAGQAALAGFHIPEAEGWNVATVSARPLRDAVLITWATRSRGLILARGLSGIRGLADLAGKRIATRPESTGTARLWVRLLEEQGLAPASFPEVGPAHTESDAAGLVAEGAAEATLGLAGMARRFDLPFLPLLEERFDLLICRRAYFTPPVQTLLRFARQPAFAERARRLQGYDLGAAETVQWIAP